MKLTEEMILFAESKQWDDDLRQDLYEQILEMDDEPVDNVEAFMSVRYRNLQHNSYYKKNNRDQLLNDNMEEVKNWLTHGDDCHADPMEIYQAWEDMTRRLAELTDVLQGTIVKVYMEGKTPQEVAIEEGEDSNTIYARVHRAKKQLQGEK